MTAPASTPILDRTKPLPPPVTLFSTLPLVPTAMVVFALTAVAIYYALRALNTPAVEEWLMQSLGGMAIVGTILLLVAAFFAAIAVHEIGHAVGGAATGLRLISLRVGPVVFSRSKGLSFFRAGATGEAMFDPGSAHSLRRAAAVMIAAGPAANLCAGIALLPFSKGTFLFAFTVFTLIIGVAELLPLEGEMGVLDGRRLAMLASDGPRTARWFALWRLEAESWTGTPPELLPARLLAAATAIRDRSVDAAMAHALAFAAAVHQQHYPRAEQLLEACLEAAGYGKPAFRAALISDAAMFQALIRKSPAMARSWAADLPKGCDAMLRERIETAIASSGVESAP